MTEKSRYDTTNSGNADAADSRTRTPQQQSPTLIRRDMVVTTRDTNSNIELPIPTITRELFSTTGNGSSTNNGTRRHGDNSGTTTTGPKPGDLVTIPHPHDVLFPIRGFYMWPGNEVFITKVNEYRDEFLHTTTTTTTRSRSEQCRLAIKIVNQIVFGTNGQKQPAARFLLKYRTNPDNAAPGTVHPWIVMEDTSILVQLGKAFRKEIELKPKKRKDKSKHKKKKHKKEKKRKRTDDEYDDEDYDADYDYSAVQHNNTVQGGYNNQLQHDDDNNRINHENTDDEDGDEEDDTDEEGHDPLYALKQLVQYPNQASYSATSSVDRSDRYHHQQLASSSSSNTRLVQVQPTIIKTEENDNYERKKKRKYSLNSISNSNSFAAADPTVATTATTTTKAAITTTIANDDEDSSETTLPKGVTVRPSGKWQAQTYFAGQSRYVGVYPNSRLAAHSYRVVQVYIKLYRAQLQQQTGRDYNECTKEEVAAVFNAARREADKSVQQLEEIIRTGNYRPIKTEQQLVNDLENSITFVVESSSDL